MTGFSCMDLAAPAWLAGLSSVPPENVLGWSWSLLLQPCQHKQLAGHPAALAWCLPAALPRFPIGTANELAAGMSAEVCVRFSPQSLGDYEDTFIVETLQGRSVVPLKACRPHPQLTLPSELQVC